VLHFSHVAPIDALIQQLQQKLCNSDRGKLTRRLEIDKDMNAPWSVSKKAKRLKNTIWVHNLYFIA
jgi:hypothetical protein